MLKIVSFLCLYIRVIESIGSTCDNRDIVINGLIPPVATPLFSTIPKLYEVERKAVGRNVAIKAKEIPISELSSSLKSFTKNGEPVVFGVTTSKKSVKSNEARFPLMASALVVLYNLPGINELTLSLTQIVYLYKNDSIKWNNNYVARSNPNITLPNEEVRPIVRADSDDSTVLFTDVLSANNKLWKKDIGTIRDPDFVGGKCCNSTKWPPSIYLYANSTVGMVGVIASIPYTVGYAILPLVRQYTVSQATLSVSKGEVLLPTVENVQAAIRLFVKNDGPDDLLPKLEITNDTSGDVYPMTAFTYFMLNQTYEGVDCCVIEELVGFLDWFLFSWSEKELIELQFVPLIPELKANIKRIALERITCRGEPVLPKYLASKILASSGSGLHGWEMALIAGLVLLLIATIVCFSLYMLYKRYQENNSSWLIDSSRLKILSGGDRAEYMVFESRPKSQMMEITMFPPSVQSKPLPMSSDSGKDKMIVAELDQSKVYMDKIEGKFPQHWPVAVKRRFRTMRSLSHKNVSTLLGVTVFNRQTYVLFEYSSKGTLHFMLTTTKYNLVDEIKYQFAMDISKGMQFLHESGMVHGRLTSLTCYLDSSWTVKVAQWEESALRTGDNFARLSDLQNIEDETIFDEDELIKLIYTDPDSRRSVNEDVDVYSFGLLLVEIFTRQIPYTTDVVEDNWSFKELLTKKFTRNASTLPNVKGLPQRVAQLVLACVSKDSNRPTFGKIFSELKSASKISTGIIDIILDALEQHVEKLEEKVEGRTIELKHMTDRMKLLLHQVLPPQIAEKLFTGEPVPPEYFENVTIYFSDIVGFTSISARSTPIQVMSLLNDLWVSFDSITDKFDVYKVDTIGDAYMVCSGVPAKNGVNHVREISFVALALLDKCNSYKMKHLPNETLKIRIGINSGPVTAGVVGSKMPQYCLFGDTVNTAARMESTSEEQRIQISDVTQQLLINNFSTLFKMEYRGQISVKGKGNMHTFWLLGKQ